VGKKKRPASAEEKRRWVDPRHPELSIRRQCALLGLSRSSFYYEPAHESPEDLALMRCIDAQYTRTPFYGSRRMTVALCQQGYGVNRKRVQRLMRWMGLWGIAPGPRTSRTHPEHKVYSYLLREVVVERPNQVRDTSGSVLTIQQIPVISGWLVIVFALLKSFYSAAHRHVMNAEMRADVGHGIGPREIGPRHGLRPIGVAPPVDRKVQRHQPPLGLGDFPQSIATGAMGNEAAAPSPGPGVGAVAIPLGRIGKSGRASRGHSPKGAPGGGPPPRLVPAPQSMPAAPGRPPGPPRGRGGCRRSHAARRTGNA